MADATVADRPPTRDEIRILRHYADGQQIKHICAIVGQDTEAVRGVIDEWTGFTRQRAKDVIRRWWLVAEPAVNPSAEPPPTRHKSAPAPVESGPEHRPPADAAPGISPDPAGAALANGSEWRPGPDASAGTIPSAPADASPDSPAEPEQSTDSSTSADLVSVSGVSYRQLDHWTRKGYLQCANPGAGSGVARIWPDTELRVAETMCRLRDVGLSVETAHLVARAGGRVELAPGIWVAVDTPAEVIPAPLEGVLDGVLLRAVKAGGEHGRRAGQLRQQVLALGAELDELDRIAAQQKRVEELRRQLDAEEAKLRDLTSPGAPKQEEAAA